MNAEPASRTLRGLVAALAAALLWLAAGQIRLEDAPIYAAFVLVSWLVGIEAVEVLPGVRLRASTLAVSLGFVYIGGLPVLVFSTLAGLVQQLASTAAPEGLARRVPQLRSGRAGVEAPLWTPDGWVEEGTALIGQAVRWWTAVAVAGRLDPGQPVWRSMGAVATAELVGYVAWALLAALPIHPDRSLMRLRAVRDRKVGTALSDTFLVVVVLITPFVFLMLYGYALHGLVGAAAWASTSVLPHLVLQRLSERRIQLEEQNERLEALNRELAHRERLSAIGRMSSVISHQMLQQLGVIGIYANLVRNVAAEGDPEAALARVRAHGAAIEEALDDVNRVLRDLLVFSRELRVNVYPHSVPALLEEVREACSAQADEAGSRIRVAAPDGLVATFDKLKLRQALENIVRNALEASPPGSEVRIEAATRDGDLAVAVEDEGPGVPEASREAVFTPFFTTKARGTGLGLAIARAFVAAHGGRIEVGRGRVGARFVVHLPAAPERPASAASGAA